MGLQLSAVWMMLYQNTKQLLQICEKYSNTHYGTMVSSSSVCLQLLMLSCFRVLCLLEDLRGDATDPISFKTPSCEPDAPSPPKLHAQTVNCITLKWNVCTDVMISYCYFIR